MPNGLKKRQIVEYWKNNGFIVTENPMEEGYERTWTIYPPIKKK